MTTPDQRARLRILFNCLKNLDNGRREAIFTGPERGVFNYVVRLWEHCGLKHFSEFIAVEDQFSNIVFGDEFLDGLYLALTDLNDTNYTVFHRYGLLHELVRICSLEPDFNFTPSNGVDDMPIEETPMPALLKKASRDHNIAESKRKASDLKVRGAEAVVQGFVNTHIKNINELLANPKKYWKSFISYYIANTVYNQDVYAILAKNLTKAGYEVFAVTPITPNDQVLTIRINL